MSKIKILLESKTAKMPEKGTEESAGYDLFADLPETVRLKAGERMRVPVGIKLEMPKGFYGKVESRSGTAIKDGIGVLCGVIDSDYRGSLSVVLFNTSEEDFLIKNGQKVAQIVFHELPEVELVQVKKLSKSERGTGGFGSTGK